MLRAVGVADWDHTDTFIAFRAGNCVLVQFLACNYSHFFVHKHVLYLVILGAQVPKWVGNWMQMFHFLGLRQPTRDVHSTS